MMKALAMAYVFALGVDLRRVGVLAMALFLPLPTLLVIALLVWRFRPHEDLDCVVFCDAVAAELRAGASPRQALARSADSIGLSEMADAVLLDDWAGLGAKAAMLFPEVGRELETVIRRAPQMGGPLADLFEEISSVALAQVQVAQEIASASAPARASALVLVAAPVAVIAYTGARRDLGDYLETGAQRWAALAGVVLVVAGLVLGLAMLRRAR